MKQLLTTLLRKLPYIKKLEMIAENQGAFPAGHYYSPIPSREEVLAYIQSRTFPAGEPPGINLNAQSQYDLLNEYAAYYQDIPFQEKPQPGHRFYYENDLFSYSDAIFLYCFLRKFTPKTIIEVGSGFSSAVLLDTIDDVYKQKPDVIFIEPDPDRLISLLKEDDKQQVRLIDKKIQEISTDFFSVLEPGDFLFIDSSHVVKCGSDLQMLILEILPRLKPGVFVHFHDVFYPFDYPSQWLVGGRYWNESYFLRAFLSYNCEWTILFFNTYVHHMFADLVKEKMPLCFKRPGGSLYIQRKQKCQ